MKFFASSAAPARQQTDCAIVGIYKARRLTDDAKALDKSSRGAITTAIKNGDVDGKLGATLLLGKAPNVSSKRILLVGLGTQRDFGVAEYRKACEAAISVLRGTGARNAISYLSREKVNDTSIYDRIRHGAAVASSCIYRFDELKSKPDRKFRLSKLGFATATDADESEVERGLGDASAIAAGVAVARDLGNRPPNVCTPTHLAEQGKALAKDYEKVTTKVLGRA
ncbi:MAG: leucyl aminopeptidase, partial [Gammaproteobacteria bacterium]|nr:leucyl aminopeptidase [Gammaproteobacteria bacterium]